MKMREAEARTLAALWPLRPADAATVPFTALIAVVFGSDHTGGDSGWLWTWIGISFGLVVVLIRIHRRVRSAVAPPEPQEHPPG